MECKRLAVMQPYFFPYAGYFSLIDSVDYFMFFDDIQFQRKSWMCRNRLLNIENENTFFFRPAIKKPKYKEMLFNVELDNNEDWKQKIVEQLNSYKSKSPFYREVKDLLNDIFVEKHIRLVDFNMRSVEKISMELQIKTTFEKFTDYNYWFDEKPTAGTWGLEIAKKRQAECYINAPGGEKFIKPEGFNEANIRLGFIQPKLEPYNQGISSFVPGLSILDVILFNGLEKTSQMVKDYEIKWKVNE